MKKLIGLLLMVGMLSSCATIGPVVTDMYYLSDGTLVMEKTAIRVDNLTGVVLEGNRTVEPVRIR